MNDDVIIYSGINMLMYVGVFLGVYVIVYAHFAELCLTIRLKYADT